MKFHVVALAAIALTSSVSTAPVAYAHDGPGRDNTGVIVTQSGPVRGALHATSAAFLGIPYARPPVGDRRWRPPKPLGHWSGVLDATVPGKHCLQSSAVVDHDASEVCLFLNV